jgi:hypothetical protein
VLGALLKREKLNWKSLAESSQTEVHRTIRCSGWLPQRTAALGKSSARRGYNSPDCPVCHRTVRCANRAHANGRQRNQRVTRGLRHVPRASWLQRSVSPENEGNRHCSLSGAPTDRRQLWPSKWSSNGSKLSWGYKVFFSSRIVTWMTTVMIHTRVTTVISLNKPISISSVVSYYG